MLVLASANVSYDDTPYRQVKRLLPVINLIINDYTKYLVDENNTKAINLYNKCGFKYEYSINNWKREK